MLVPNLLLVDFGFGVPAFVFRKLEDFVSGGDFPSSVTLACREGLPDIGLPCVRRGSRRIVRVSKRNGRVMASLTFATAILRIGIATRAALAGFIGTRSFNAIAEIKDVDNWPSDLQRSLLAS